MNITEFLLARIAEDEAVATDCLAVPFGYSWRTISWLHGANREHGKRHSPTRVLAECAAKRAIVGLHGATHDYADHYRKPTPLVVCVECGPHEDVDWRTGGQGNFPCSTLRHLAAVYADHPDYDQAWRIA